MIEVVVKILGCFLLGSVLGGDLMRRLLGGADLRGEGSGNVGATNALRTRGPGFALGVLAIDIGKGVIAALLVPVLPWPFAPGDPALHALLPYGCGLAAALGHCFPPFHGFRGGKGVATLTGVFGALIPPALPGMVAVFVLTILLTGYVSLGSLLGALGALAYVALCGAGLASSAGLFTLAMIALLVFKHRENLRRLLAGSESRFEKARLIGRLFDRPAP